jgi:hypothetical protein
MVDGSLSMMLAYPMVVTGSKKGSVSLAIVPPVKPTKELMPNSKFTVGVPDAAAPTSIQQPPLRNDGGHPCTWIEVKVKESGDDAARSAAVKMPVVESRVAVPDKVAPSVKVPLAVRVSILSARATLDVATRKRGSSAMSFERIIDLAVEST